MLDRRERLFRAAGVGSVVEFRARRAAGEFPAEAATDVLLVIDGYLVLRGEFDDLRPACCRSPRRAFVRLHLVVTASWSRLRPALKDAPRQSPRAAVGRARESEVDRRRAVRSPHDWDTAWRRTGTDGAGCPVARPAGRRHRRSSWPPCLRVDRPCRSPRSRCCQIWCTSTTSPPSPWTVSVRRGGIPIGWMRRVSPRSRSIWARTRTWLLLRTRRAARPRLCGCRARRPRGTGRTSCASWSSTTAGAARRRRRHAPARVREYGRRGREAAHDIAASLRERLPGPTVGPRELRERSWWSGPEVVVLVDDYDLVAPGGATVHPLLPLLEFLPQAKDVGLHVVVTRRCGGAARALFDPLLGRLRELAVPGLVMNGSPTRARWSARSGRSRCHRAGARSSTGGAATAASSSRGSRPIRMRSPEEPVREPRRRVGRERVGAHRGRRPPPTAARGAAGAGKRRRARSARGRPDGAAGPVRGRTDHRAWCRPTTRGAAGCPSRDSEKVPDIARTWSLAWLGSRTTRDTLARLGRKLRRPVGSAPMSSVSGGRRPPAGSPSAARPRRRHGRLMGGRDVAITGRGCARGPSPAAGGARG